MRGRNEMMIEVDYKQTVPPSAPIGCADCWYEMQTIHFDTLEEYTKWSISSASRVQVFNVRTEDDDE